MLAPGDSLDNVFPRLLVNDVTLKSLDLSGGRIGCEGLNCLTDVLRLINTAVTSLNLSKNKISNVEKLAQALESNSRIRALKLADNDLGDESATRLAKMLAKNTSLTDLNLSYNPIGNKGALQLVAVLRSHPSLTSLDVGYDAIDEAGILAIGESLKKIPFQPKFRLVGVKLSTCWKALDLPCESKAWDNDRILDFFRQRHECLRLQDIQLDGCISSRVLCATGSRVP